MTTVLDEYVLAVYLIGGDLAFALQAICIVASSDAYIVWFRRRHPCRWSETASGHASDGGLSFGILFLIEMTWSKSLDPECWDVRIRSTKVDHHSAFGTPVMPLQCGLDITIIVPAITNPEWLPLNISTRGLREAAGAISHYCKSYLNQ